MDTCSVDGCEDRLFARGLCGAHYQRLKKYGDVLAHIPKNGKTRHEPDGTISHVTRTILPCSVDGCDREAFTLAGYCGVHYQRVKKYGNPQADRPIAGSARLPHGRCKIDGCCDHHEARGYCSTHYGRWRQHGEDGVERPIDRDPKQVAFAQRIKRLLSSRRYGTDSATPPSS